MKPFWSRRPTADDAVSLAKYDKVFWNSRQVRFTETLGYTYPETKDRLTVGEAERFKVVVEQTILKAYPGPLRPKAQIAKPRTTTSRLVSSMVADEAKVGPAPGVMGFMSAIAVPAAMAIPAERDPSSLIGPDNSYTDWTVNIRAVKHILGRPYQVVVFDGDFDPDPARWLTEYNKVGTVAILGQDEDTGCDKCRDDQATQLSVTGVVGLTSALIQDFVAGHVDSLDPGDVVPYLKRHLHWRVVVDGVTDVPREQVPGLSVCVSSTRVTFDEHGIPRYSPDHELHTDITDRRPAGLSAGEQP